MVKEILCRIFIKTYYLKLKSPDKIIFYDDSTSLQIIKKTFILNIYDK